MTVDLDDLDEISRIDSEDVLGAVERFADQCREAWAIGKAATRLPDPFDIDGVMVLGMGGSGVSGDVLQVVLEPDLNVPVAVLKSYGPLPGWVGPATLVLAVSYSGSTEETIAAAEDAVSAGARVLAVSSGGPLADLARKHDLPHVSIPSGLQPRASLGYLALPLLAVLQRIGLARDLDAEIEEAGAVLDELAARCHRSVPAAENPAKQLALEIRDRIAIVYGAHGIAALAAMRFKCDLNEYGKVPAFWNAFPELNHNEIVGWSGLTDVTRANAVIVLLRDLVEHERVAMRIAITRRLIADSASGVVEVKATGESSLARLLSLVFVTQLAAIYVGLARGVDPGPVEVIQQLKAELAQRDTTTTSS